jgi:dTDP-4-amino-4,6-dideoxygalactose transaminase
MNIPLVDLKAQYQEIKKDLDFTVLKVLENGNFILGEEVGSFEKEFAKYCGTKYCVGVASGWEAIFLSLKALGIGQGDEVITAANTFIATVFPIIETGAKPVLVDIDPRTYQIDPELVEKVVTKKTKAILPVHLFGFPADLDEITKIARKYRLWVIEDAAQAHGSLYKGRHCGGVGDLGAFSFYPGKNLGAAGDAGAIVTNKKILAEKIRIMRDVGQSKKYYHTLFGYNSRLDTLQAAILSVKLKKLNLWNKQRKVLARLYDQLLADLPIVLPPKPNRGLNGNYHLYVIRTTKRDQLLEYLKDKGVYGGIHYPIPVHLQKALKGLGYQKGDFPITEKYAQEILSLPIYPQLRENEVRQISKLIHRFFKK